MFIQEDFYQAEPDVVAAVMTELSMKSGLRAWGTYGFLHYGMVRLGFAQPVQLQALVRMEPDIRLPPIRQFLPELGLGRLGCRDHKSQLVVRP